MKVLISALVGLVLFLGLSMAAYVHDMNAIEDCHDRGMRAVNILPTQVECKPYITIRFGG